MKTSQAVFPEENVTLLNHPSIKHGVLEIPMKLSQRIKTPFTSGISNRSYGFPVVFQWFSQDCPSRADDTSIRRKPHFLKSSLACSKCLSHGPPKKRGHWKRVENMGHSYSEP